MAALDEANSRSQAAAQLRMLETMVRMQESHNLQVHPQWREQGFAYYRAIWVECAELLDHYGWKWWKHTVPDMDQSRLELVDIWHFGLSDLMLRGQLSESILTAFEAPSAETPVGPSGADFRAAVEQLALVTLDTKGFALDAFANAMASLPMSFNELFEMYVGKNVLNSFRQNNGYKTGSYRKLWAGREDNEHLVEALAALPPDTPDFPEKLYEELQSRYDTTASDV